MAEKGTLVQKVDVTGMGVDALMKELHNKIDGMRNKGWHFSSYMPVDWLCEKDKSEPSGYKTKQYIICTFCK
jgi:hypothetical protein